MPCPHPRVRAHIRRSIQKTIRNRMGMRGSLRCLCNADILPTLTPPPPPPLFPPPAPAHFSQIATPLELAILGPYPLVPSVPCRIYRVLLVLLGRGIVWDSRPARTLRARLSARTVCIYAPF